MSYYLRAQSPLARRLKARHKQPTIGGSAGRSALGFDLVDFLTGQPISAMRDAANAAEDKGCLSQGDNAQQTLNNMADDLQQNWNPSGVYTPGDMNTILQQVNNILTDANQQWLQVTSGTLAQGAIDSLASLEKDVQQRFTEWLDYKNDVQNATSQGLNAIAAPYLKKWVLQCMDAAGNLLYGVTVSACMKPWWLAAYDGIVAIWNKAVQIIKAIGGAIIAAGEAVYEAAKHGIGFIGAVLTYAPYAIVGLAGWWLYMKFVKKKS